MTAVDQLTALVADCDAINKLPSPVPEDHAAGFTSQHPLDTVFE
jgi:hypothetical protein